METLNAISAAQGVLSEKTQKSISDLRERVEEIEARGSQPVTAREPRAAREHKARFVEWLRRPRDGAAANALEDFQRAEAKSLAIASGPDGGFAVPEEIAREIERLELKLSPVRRLVRTINIGSSDFKHLIDIRGAEAGWVGETGSRTETDTPQLRLVQPTMGELYAYPQTTEWALDDVFFDVASWLAESAAQQFARLEGDAVIRGDGSNKPTGMLDTTPVTTPDQNATLRDAAAYQFIASPNASTAAVHADALIDLVYTVNSAYRSGATW